VRIITYSRDKSSPQRVANDIACYRLNIVLSTQSTVVKPVSPQATSVLLHFVDQAGTATLHPTHHHFQRFLLQLDQPM